MDRTIIAAHDIFGIALTGIPGHQAGTGIHCIVAVFAPTPLAIFADRCRSFHFIASLQTLHATIATMQRNDSPVSEYFATLPLRQEARERRKRGTEADRKPFVEAQRVTSPVRESLASTRKRVLRRGWQHPRRSVNSECRGSAMEPRNRLIVGALVVGKCGGRAKPPGWPGGEVLPGSKNRAQAHGGLPGT